MIMWKPYMCRHRTWRRFKDCITEARIDPFLRRVFTITSDETESQEIKRKLKHYDKKVDMYV